MNFKKIGLGVAVTAVISIGAAFSEAPAQAISFGDKLKIDLDGQVLSIGASGVDLVNTDLGSAALAGSTGSFGTYTGVTVNDLFTTVPLGGYDLLTLTGGSDGPLVFRVLEYLDPDLDLVGNRSFTAGLRGIFNPIGVGTVSDQSTLATFRFLSGFNEGEIEIVAVPTPALLPGLIGMGIAAFRKRKEAEEGVGQAS